MLEPVTAVGDPPAYVEDRDRGSKRPPERQDEVGGQAEHGEADPEYFLLHSSILSRAFLSFRKRIKRWP